MELDCAGFSWLDKLFFTFFKVIKKTLRLVILLKNTYCPELNEFIAEEFLQTHLQLQLLTNKIERVT